MDANDLTDDELADFAELAKDDERMKRLEKFQKWRDREKTKTVSPTPSDQNPLRLSVADLRTLLEDDTTRSILSHLLSTRQPSKEEKKSAGAGQKENREGLGARLKLI